MDGAYRPLFLTGLSLVGRLTDFQPVAFRALSLALHALNALLLFALARSLFALPSGAAFASALIFLLHPVEAHSLAMVWKQSDLWIALALLLSLQRGPFLALGLFVVACTVKESAVVLPLSWLAIEPIRPAEGRRTRIGTAVFALGLFMVSYFLLRPLLPTSAEGTPNPHGRLTYFRTELTVLPLYFRVLLLPALSSIDRAVTAVTAWSLSSVWASLLLGGALVLAIARSWMKRSKGATAFLLAAIWMIPTSTVQPLSLFYDETRVYLALGLLAMAAGAAVSPRLGRTVLSILTLVLLSTSLILDARWKSAEALWESALSVDPQSARAHYELGVLADVDRAWDDAEAHYRQAIALSDPFWEAQFNLGLVLGRKGDLKGAERMFQTLLAGPREWPAIAHYHLGLSRMYEGELTAAQEEFSLVRQNRYRAELADKGDALLLEREGRKKEAAESWRAYLTAPRLAESEKEIAQRHIARLAADPPLR